MLLGFAVLSPAEFYFSCLLLCCKILTQVTGAVLKRLFVILYHSCRLVTRKVTSCFAGVNKVYCIWEIKISSAALCVGVMYWPKLSALSATYYTACGFVCYGFFKNKMKGLLKNIKDLKDLGQ